MVLLTISSELRERANRSHVSCLEQGESGSYGDSQMSSDGTGAYESQSQSYSSQFSQGSEGDSQEKRSTFVKTKRGSLGGRPPPCGPAASSSSVSVMPLIIKLFSLAILTLTSSLRPGGFQAYINSVNKASSSSARAPSPVCLRSQLLPAVLHASLL